MSALPVTSLTRCRLREPPWIPRDPRWGSAKSLGPEGRQIERGAPGADPRPGGGVGDPERLEHSPDQLPGRALAGELIVGNLVRALPRCSGGVPAIEHVLVAIGEP